MKDMLPMHDMEKIQKLRALAEEVLGGKEGAVDMMLIELPKGALEDGEDMSSFAHDFMSETGGAPEKKKEDESDGSIEDPEGPLHKAVMELIEAWEPETPEGTKYKEELQGVYDTHKHGDEKEESGY